MIGNELAKVIQKTRGKISVGVVSPHDVFWIYAEKSDLIAWAKKHGDQETGMALNKEESCGGYYLDIDYAGQRLALGGDE